MFPANLDDLTGLLQNSSQPVNIPGSQLSNSISGKRIENKNKNIITWSSILILYILGLFVITE